jgi:hypothetical protein
MAAKTEGKQRVKITSLADLQPRTVTVEIERGDEVLEIPCKTLSYAEFQRLGYEVVDPAPPTDRWDKKGPIYNYNDPAYLQDRQKANDERMYRRLLAFVQIDVPGDTVEEQIDNLTNTLEVDIVRALVGIMSNMVTGGEARIADRAATFHE